MTFQATRREWRAHAFRRFRSASSLTGLLGAASLPAGAAVTATLADMSVEQLMEESVTSVSKKETKLSESPAAITVITADDIRRLGVTTLPEALRFAPGMDVAQVDASHWAISSRGFNLLYSNKLLVLRDGRSLYTPSFGGIPWNMQDVMLEDLDRIEIIRGPGATLWGANAVNGVINITSKNSKETQGFLLSTAAGNQLQPLTSVRYGGEINPQLHYRTYFQYGNREGFLDEAGHDAGDEWNSIRTGFRADWQASVQDLVTVQGDYFSLGTREIVTVPMFAPPYQTTGPVENASQGANLLGRWTRTWDADRHFSLQGYFDTFSGESGFNSEIRRTGDLQAEYRFALGDRNDLVSGVGYRFTTDSFDDNAQISWSDNSRDLHLYNLFLQDEITVIPDRLRFTLGSKFEHNDYTGWEIQPSARLLWTPVSRQTVWAAASHAVGTPARLYRDARVTGAIFPNPAGGPPVESVHVGANVDSEKVDAYEIGYRWEATPDLSFDLSAFYNVYNDVTGYSQGTPAPVATPVRHVVVPMVTSNSLSGHTHGAEFSTRWNPAESWRLVANYSFLQMNLHPGDISYLENPSQQVGIQSYLTLPGNFELNAAAFFTDSIGTQRLDGVRVSIPSYIRADLGLIWHASPNLEAGIFGQNLLDGSHPEFSTRNDRTVTEIPRTFFGRVTWRF